MAVRLSLQFGQHINKVDVFRLELVTGQCVEASSNSLHSLTKGSILPQFLLGPVVDYLVSTEEDIVARDRPLPRQRLLVPR